VTGRGLQVNLLRPSESTGLSDEQFNLLAQVLRLVKESQK
jgi:hypothetical protein